MEKFKVEICELKDPTFEVVEYDGTLEMAEWIEEKFWGFCIEYNDMEDDGFGLTYDFGGRFATFYGRTFLVFKDEIFVKGFSYPDFHKKYRKVINNV